MRSTSTLATLIVTKSFYEGPLAGLTVTETVKNWDPSVPPSFEVGVPIRSILNHALFVVDSYQVVL